MLKLTKVKSRYLSYLLKPVYERISMYEQFSRRFGDIEIVLKEALDRHERLTVERLKTSLLEYLLKEHFAKRCGKLIDKSSDAEVFVAYDVLFGFKYLSDVKRDLCLLVCARQILEVVNYG